MWFKLVAFIPAVKSGVVPKVDHNGVVLTSVFPANYDSSKTYPWVIFNHGSDQPGNAIATGDPALESLVSALSAAGYVVVSSNYRIEDCWGNQSCVDDDLALYEAFMASMNLDPHPFMLNASMGGMVTWNAILHGDFHPRAVAGIFPACNLADMFKVGYFNQALYADYGFSGPSTFSAATKGFDPLGSEDLKPLTKFPILMWSSDGDTTVNKTVNADMLASQVNALGGSASVIATKGVHGDPSNFQPDVLVKFFNKALPSAK